MTSPSPETLEAEKPMERRADVQARTVKDFCRVYGVGKTVAYQLIDDGKVLGVKVGRRTLIDETSARQWYEALPRARTYYGR